MGSTECLNLEGINFDRFQVGERRAGSEETVFNEMLMLLQINKRRFLIKLDTLDHAKSAAIGWWC